MDKYERRRLRLLRIRDELCDGSAASLARRLGKTDSYVHRMLYADGKQGKKRIGEESVELVRSEFGIDLDEGIGAVESSPPIAPTLKLQWIDDEEAALLSLYRATDAQGRATIKFVADDVPKVLFTQLADYQPKDRAR